MGFEEKILQFLLERNKDLATCFKLREGSRTQNPFWFDRIARSRCLVCEREHDKENAFVKYEVSRQSIKF